MTAAAASARTTLQEYRDLARMIGVSPWPPSAIFLLGLITAALEVLAITLVVCIVLSWVVVTW